MSLNRAWWDIDGTHVVIDRLNRHLAVTALGVRGARTPGIARLAKASGHDAIWVDLEAQRDADRVAAQICACAGDIGVACLLCGCPSASTA